MLKTPGVSGRVAASALGACEAFLVAAAGKFDFMVNVYKSFEPLYKQQDLDSETKEAAIRAAARAVCNVQTKLPNVTATLDVLVDRLVRVVVAVDVLGWWMCLGCPCVRVVLTSGAGHGADSRVRHHRCGHHCRVRRQGECLTGGRGALVSRRV